MTASILTEFGEQIEIKDREGFEAYLNSIWQQYSLFNTLRNPSNSSNSGRQPFFNFDGNKLRARNFIGFVSYGSNSLCVYPKVFKNYLSQEAQSETQVLLDEHLCFWLSYCNKIHFPAIQNSLAEFQNEELPQYVLYLMVKQIYETIYSKPYYAFEETSEALKNPQGRINFSRYASSIASCRHLYIDCDYEPLVYDNKVNQVIKFCVKLLLPSSRVAETNRLLSEILHVLEDVSDSNFAHTQLEQMRIQPFFQEYENVIKYCSIILRKDIYLTGENNSASWSFLLPMELVYQDFFVGFIVKHFSNKYRITEQASDLYLQQSPKTFKLQHDILLRSKENNNKIFIVDTKYKPRWDLENQDNKKGVAQSDMYQMISYALRRGVSQVLLIYPNTSEKQAEDHTFRVQSGFDNSVIEVKICEIPFWSSNNNIDMLEKRLIDRVKEILV